MVEVNRKSVLQLNSCDGLVIKVTILVTDIATVVCYTINLTNLSKLIILNFFLFEWLFNLYSLILCILYDILSRICETFWIDRWIFVGSNCLFLWYIFKWVFLNRVLLLFQTFILLRLHALLGSSLVITLMHILVQLFCHSHPLKLHFNKFINIKYLTTLCAQLKWIKLYVCRSVVSRHCINCNSYNLTWQHLHDCGHYKSFSHFLIKIAT